MSYGSSLGITLPTIDGVATEAQAAPLINTALQTIIDVLESKVQPSGMDINADLSFRSGGSYFGAKDLQRSAYTSLAAALSAGTYPGTIYRVGTDLYYNDGDGNQIQITASGAVNVAATGGITGLGYGTGSVEVNWDAASSVYKMRSGPNPDDFASVTANDVLLNDAAGHFARLGSPALAADYTLLVPTGLPASTSVVTLDSGGQLASTLSPTLTSLTVTSSVDLSTASVALRSRWKQFHPASGQSISGGAFNVTTLAWKASASGGQVIIPLLFDESSSIRQIEVMWATNSTAVKTLGLYYVNGTGTTTAAKASTTSTVNTGGGVALLTWNFTDFTVSAPNILSGALNTSTHYLVFSFNAGAANDTLYGIRVQYTPYA